MVAVSRRSRREAGEVGAGTRFAEELAPGNGPVVHVGHEPADLLGCPVREDGGRGHEEPQTSGRDKRPAVLERGADGDRGPRRVAATSPVDREVRGADHPAGRPDPTIRRRGAQDPSALRANW